MPLIGGCSVASWIPAIATIRLAALGAAMKLH